MHDLRHALRALFHSPGFTVVAALLLAIGIGANAVIFGALDAILLRTLPARHPEQLVHIVLNVPRAGHRSIFAYSFYKELQEHAGSLSTVFGEEQQQVDLQEPAPAGQIQVHLVTPEYFDALSASALFGRTLNAADANVTAGVVPAVLSYGFWERRFAGDRGAVGRTVKLHGHVFPIVGILRKEFNGISAETAPDVVLPLRAAPLLRHSALVTPMESRWLDLSARLRPGVTIERALPEIRALWLATPEGRETPAHQPLMLDSLEHGTSILRDRFRGALRLLIASVALLQLLVCANLAGLLVARGARRSGEVAIRLALGATRGRLVRQMLVESAVLTAMGAAGGIALAYIVSPLLAGALPPVRDLMTTQLTLSVDFSPNATVLLYSIAISAVTALLFGMAPAIAAARVSVDGVLRGARVAGGWKGRQVLLVLQIALCTLLLAGAGLMVRSFRQLRYMDPGFASAQVVSFSADPTQTGFTDEQGVALQRALLERLREIPGVESAGVASRPLMRGSGMKTTVVHVGETPRAADFLNASMNGVSPDYFEAVGMRLVAGRNLEDTDAKRTPLPVEVNQAFVRRFFPDENPVGRLFGPKGDFQIVGVVTDAHYRSLREPVPPTYYQLNAYGDFTIYVRTRGRPEAVIQPVVKQFASLAPNLAFTEIHTLAEEVDQSAAPERLTAILASVFGVFAALLAAVGLYGLLAYAVAQRQREIGIRMALGAQPRAIAGLVGGRALGLVAMGVALGIAGALVLAPMAGALLYGVSPTDPASLTAAAILVALVAALASFLPAARAARVDPAEALRQ